MNHGQSLYDAGIPYYDWGTIKKGRKLTAYYFELSKPVTPEQLELVRKIHPHVMTGWGNNQYAPEDNFKVLIFLSAAQLKRNLKLKGVENAR